MRPGFSEFSYAYALTEALVAEQRYLVQPVFPNQRKEAQLGYDLELQFPGYPLFLQYKLCNGVTINRAKELVRYRLPLNLPYLRMNIMPTRRSRQHPLLLELDARGEEVFYAAPRFFTSEDFTTHYQKQRMIPWSAFIRPSSIGELPDDRKHHISFDTGATFGWFLSEPKKLEPILDGGEAVESLDKALDEAIRTERTVSERIGAALTNILAIIEAVKGVEREVDETGEDPRAKAFRLGQLAHRYFDASVLLVSKRDPGE